MKIARLHLQTAVYYSNRDVMSCDHYHGHVFLLFTIKHNLSGMSKIYGHKSLNIEMISVQAGSRRAARTELQPRINLIFAK